MGVLNFVSSMWNLRGFRWDSSCNLGFQHLHTDWGFRLCSIAFCRLLRQSNIHFELLMRGWAHGLVGGEQQWLFLQKVLLNGDLMCGMISLSSESPLPTVMTTSWIHRESMLLVLISLHFQRWLLIYPRHGGFLANASSSSYFSRSRVWCVVVDVKVK